MHEELWAGVDLKLDHASFHLDQMARCLERKRDTMTVVLESAGAIVGEWQRPLFAHLDAFLSAARSAPEIIKCCFGRDRHPKMDDWWDHLPAEQQRRREDFWRQFKARYDAFGQLPLSQARHISEHRTGYPTAATATINGLFGVTHVGSPVKRVPLTEIRTDVPEELAWLPKPQRVWPIWIDFTIDGQNLFDACRDYLQAAQGLAAVARGIAQQVHGINPLTPPQ